MYPLFCLVIYCNKINSRSALICSYLYICKESSTVFATINVFRSEILSCWLCAIWMRTKVKHKGRQMNTIRRNLRLARENVSHWRWHGSHFPAPSPHTVQLRMIMIDDHTDASLKSLLYNLSSLLLFSIKWTQCSVGNNGQCRCCLSKLLQRDHRDPQYSVLLFVISGNNLLLSQG